MQFHLDSTQRDLTPSITGHAFTMTESGRCLFSTGSAFNMGLIDAIDSLLEEVLECGFGVGQDCCIFEGVGNGNEGSSNTVTLYNKVTWSIGRNEIGDLS